MKESRLVSFVIAMLIPGFMSACDMQVDWSDTGQAAVAETKIDAGVSGTENDESDAVVEDDMSEPEQKICEGSSERWNLFVDADGDGFGVGEKVLTCTTIGYTHIDGDCDDEDANVYPDADGNCGVATESDAGSNDAGSTDAGSESDVTETDDVSDQDAGSTDAGSESDASSTDVNSESDAGAEDQDAGSTDVGGSDHDAGLTDTESNSDAGQSTGDTGTSTGTATADTGSSVTDTTDTTDTDTGSLDSDSTDTAQTDGGTSSGTATADAGSPDTGDSNQDAGSTDVGTTDSGTIADADSDSTDTSVPADDLLVGNASIDIAYFKDTKLTLSYLLASSEEELDGVWDETVLEYWSDTVGATFQIDETVEFVKIDVKFGGGGNILTLCTEDVLLSGALTTLTVSSPFVVGEWFTWTNLDGSCSLVFPISIEDAVVQLEPEEEPDFEIAGGPDESDAGSTDTEQDTQSSDAGSVDQAADTSTQEDTSASVDVVTGPAMAHLVVNSVNPTKMVLSYLVADSLEGLGSWWAEEGITTENSKAVSADFALTPDVRYVQLTTTIGTSNLAWLCMGNGQTAALLAGITANLTVPLPYKVKEWFLWSHPSGSGCNLVFELTYNQ